MRSKSSMIRTSSVLKEKIKDSLVQSLLLTTVMILRFDYGTILLDGSDENGSKIGSSELPTPSWLLWDARVNRWRAPAFRYSHVLNWLSDNKITYADKVRRSDKNGGHWSNIDLRPYQKEALCSWRVSGRRGMVVLPTGSGKTMVALAAMAESNVNILCLVPTRILVEQWQIQIGRFYSGTIGIYGKTRANSAQKAKSQAIKIAAQGRAVGIHLIIATQRPDVRAVDGQIKANLSGMLAFQMPNHASSMTILDNTRAAHLPKIGGRAIWKTGLEMVELQTPFLTFEEATKLLEPHRKTKEGQSESK